MNAAPDKLYFIECTVTGRVKIGIAGDVDSRIQQLQSASPTRLSLLAVHDGGRCDELRIHSAFEAERLHGEWFTGSDGLRAFIDDLLRRKQAAVDDLPVRPPSKYSLRRDRRRERFEARARAKAS